MFLTFWDVPFLSLSKSQTAKKTAKFAGPSHSGFTLHSRGDPRPCVKKDTERSLSPLCVLLLIQSIDQGVIVG